MYGWWKYCMEDREVEGERWRLTGGGGRELEVDSCAFCRTIFHFWRGNNPLHFHHHHFFREKEKTEEKNPKIVFHH